MSALAGLPPLPKALSASDTLHHGSVSSMSSQARVSKNDSKSAHKKNDSSMGLLRREMQSLRQMDLSLLTQLMCLHDNLQELKHCLIHDRASSVSPSSSRSLDLGTLDNIEEQPEYENLRFHVEGDLLSEVHGEEVIYENIPPFRDSHTALNGSSNEAYLSPGEMSRLPYSVALELMSLPPPPPVPSTTPPVNKQRRKSSSSSTRKSSEGKKVSDSRKTPEQSRALEAKKSAELKKSADSRKQGESKGHRHSVGQQQSMASQAVGGRSSSSSDAARKPKSRKERRRSAGDARPPQPGSLGHQ